MPIPHLPAPDEWPTGWDRCAACGGSGKEAAFRDSFVIGEAFPRRALIQYGDCRYCDGKGGHVRYHPLDPRHPNNRED